MNYRQTKELEDREIRRSKILSGECPHCSKPVHPHAYLNEINKSFDWYHCDNCGTTMGVQKL